MSSVFFFFAYQQDRYIVSEMNRRINPLYLIFPAFLLPVTGSSAENSVDFAREVLPILSNKCFVCHGPDAKEDEVRLDSFEGATVDLGGYKAINPDSPEDSELFHRINDKEDPMPPDKAEKKLTEKERDVLTRWAKSGGAYTKHWAFVRPEKAAGKKAGIDFLLKSCWKNPDTSQLYRLVTMFWDGGLHMF